jgi:hypothetical protein
VTEHAAPNIRFAEHLVDLVAVSKLPPFAH